MALFAVMSPSVNVKLEAAIKNKYPNSFYMYSSTQWFISSKSTAKEISDQLGISIKQDHIGSAVVVGVNGYWGRANNDLWDWMKAKTEESENG
jgi:hypothetical protein